MWFIRRILYFLYLVIFLFSGLFIAGFLAYYLNDGTLSGPETADRMLELFGWWPLPISLIVFAAFSLKGWLPFVYKKQEKPNG
ncbi:hypothetical protein AYI87_02125 [Shewanella sp. KCT]|nr:hypothetical protein AYI87_02125 [Shewanella sp. KCT]